MRWQFAYPIAIIRALASFKFFPALVIHIEIVAVFGLYYRWKVRNQPKDQRVGALAFLPLSIMMPVAYALLAPLALFTLDSGSWETRGHSVPELVPHAANDAMPELVTSPHVLIPEVAVATSRARTVDRHTGSQAQLPAA